MSKILIVNTYYYPNNIGGAESVVQKLAEELHRKEYEVAIYSSDGKEKMSKEQINGVLVYRGVEGRYVRQPAHNGKNPISVRIQNNINHRMNIFIKKELNFIITDFKPDIIHTHNLYGLSTQVWRYSKARNMSIVHTIHDYWLLNSSIYFWGKRNSKYPDYITAPSKFVIDKFKQKKYFECKKYEVVPNGIEINISKIKEIVEEKLNRENKKIKFLYVGQLGEIKGINILLKEFSGWNNKNVELNICGQGNLDDLVLQYSKRDSRIHFWGQVSKDKLDQIYNESDVLIAPSIWEEPFGMVAIEAYQHGLVVIAGKRGGLIDIVENVEVGYLVEPTLEGELLKYMKLYTDRNKIKNEIKKIPEKIQIYSLNQEIDGYCNIYEKILTKKE
ncbi:MAG: glycosyltransferase family 4 protein [Anaerobutyricum soehngenii]